MTYEEALQPPNGVGNTPPTSKCWQFSPSVWETRCLRPDTVFDWAKRHSNYPDLRKASKRLIENAVGMELLDAVLNDHPLE